MKKGLFLAIFSATIVGLSYGAALVPAKSISVYIYDSERALDLQEHSEHKDIQITPATTLSSILEEVAREKKTSTSNLMVDITSSGWTRNFLNTFGRYLETLNSSFEKAKKAPNDWEVIIYLISTTQDTMAEELRSIASMLEDEHPSPELIKALAAQLKDIADNVQSNLTEVNRK